MILNRNLIFLRNKGKSVQRVLTYIYGVHALYGSATEYRHLKQKYGRTLDRFGGLKEVMKPLVEDGTVRVIKTQRGAMRFIPGNAEYEPAEGETLMAVGQWVIDE